ncbi:SO2930 family diheme c-type cytochrome [Glacieibacterium frigidum]|uniref:SO2930 family diheme c-type cytochrome n=1 Tax=Glacieibacterium frigidum TaxID=2593303 RepID=UPI00163DBB3A|nr:SO2930 family diheme c-type cytochrome [Glacieibacterium frigidum]
MSLRAPRAALAALLFALTGVAPAPAPVDLARVLAADPAPALADYRLFTDAGARTPNTGLTPYALATPLFSDYADKARLVFVPPGTAATYTATGVLEFPVGTVLVKTFAYGARKLETRLLIRKADGWVPNTYVWNDAQDAATLKRTGARIAVSWQGRTIDYAVPNANQCKQCHLSGDAVTPIGPRARNLNVAFAYAGGRENQLAHWTRTGVLRGSPAPAQVTRTPVWDDARESLDGRARAYLDVNCAHCHSRKGFASNSGLYLDLEETDPAALGVGKRPVAAGRGSGGHQFAIAPGDAAASILVHRMASTEPGVMMPQFGRTVPHAEGVALIRDWIAKLPPG